MLEVASALGAAIQIGDTTLWQRPAQQPSTTPPSQQQQQRQSQEQPSERMRGAENHTYEELGRITAGVEPSSARSIAGETEGALDAGTGSTRPKPRKSRQKEAIEG